VKNICFEIVCEEKDIEQKIIEQSNGLFANHETYVMYSEGKSVEAWRNYLLKQPIADNLVVIVNFGAIEWRKRKVVVDLFGPTEREHATYFIVNALTSDIIEVGKNSFTEYNDALNYAERYTSSTGVDTVVCVSSQNTKKIVVAYIGTELVSPTEDSDKDLPNVAVNKYLVVGGDVNAG
jgi:hypothetical protein